MFAGDGLKMRRFARAEIFDRVPPRDRCIVQERVKANPVTLPTCASTLFRSTMLCSALPVSN